MIASETNESTTQGDFSILWSTPILTIAALFLQKKATETNKIKHENFTVINQAKLTIKLEMYKPQN